MALLGRTEVGIKEFGRDIEVPENPTAKLMYYLDSICYVLDIDKSERNMRKLRDYSRYRNLSDEETDELLILCILFSPDVLINKCIFQDGDMCGADMNKFFEVSAVSDRFLITPELLIGGQTRRVQKILCFHEIWIECWYFDPIKSFQSRIRSMTARIQGRASGQRAITAGSTDQSSAAVSQPRQPTRSATSGAPRATTAASTSRTSAASVNRTSNTSAPRSASQTPRAARPTSAPAPRTPATEEKRCLIQ